jgi:hypothetical protein
MSHRLPRVRVTGWAWFGDVLCGFFGGAFLGAHFLGSGWAGAVSGLAFMVTVGTFYRHRRLARAQQLAQFRENQELRLDELQPVHAQGRLLV